MEAEPVGELRLLGDRGRLVAQVVNPGRESDLDPVRFLRHPPAWLCRSGAPVAEALALGGQVRQQP